MDFASDNTAGAAPEIVEAIARASAGRAPSYGADEATARVRRRFCELFERDVEVMLVSTGTAANGLALSTLAPPYGLIFAHAAAHAQIDECAAIEFFTGGAKVIPLSGPDGKLTPNALTDWLADYPARPPHCAPAAALTLTQSTEFGAVYRADEVAALADAAHTAGLKVHMDGARFANALVSLNTTPADITWRAGVDVLSFGATKNGCLAAEAVVFFHDADAQDAAYRRKRAGHLLSKHRLLAAQMDAYLTDELWLRLARHANAMAADLAETLESAGVLVPAPPQANTVLAALTEPQEKTLREAGAVFYPWTWPGGGKPDLSRFVASFATTPDEVRGVGETLARAAETA